MTRFSKTALAIVFSSLVSLCAAEEILFIGNSFTHGDDRVLTPYGGVPAVFQAVARAKGKDVTAIMMAPSGKDWAFHLKNKETLELIGSRAWDIVVLQDYSTRPTRIGDEKAFLRDGADLCGLVWKHNPEAKIVLYRTWARKPGNDMYSAPGKKAAFKDFEEMDGEIGKAYGRLFKKLVAANPRKTVLMAPVGEAFARSLEETPGTDVFAGDLYHASREGSYLSALVFFQTIYSESPLGAIRDFGTFSIAAETAEGLQKLSEKPE